jgi:hypothetical protein
MMVGVPSSAPTPSGKPPPQASIPPKSLYGRATRQLSSQRWTYYGTASLSNTMLLSQVILGAALTALGASESSHILITVFGAMNTIIAGLVAYLKSRGQPMRARMYRDDLERVVDEIENSEVMWLGISRGVHGYEDIDTGDKTSKDEERNPNAVTVRSEVARLTRLYERAVRNNTVNNPDMYMTGNVDLANSNAALRSRGGIAAPPPAPIVAPVVAGSGGAPTVPPAAPPPVVSDPDESPATAPPKPKDEPKKAEDPKPEVKKEEDAKGKAKSDQGDATTSKPPAASEKAKDEASAPSPSAPAPDTVESSQPSKEQGEPERDPDAEPASDPNVPLKKVPGDSADGDT